MEEHERLSILRDELTVAHKKLEKEIKNVEILEMKVEYLKGDKE